MAADHRFRTYTQLEKAYRRILARGMCARQVGMRLHARYREIADVIDATVFLGKGPSDSLTSLRQITIEGRAKVRPLRHHSFTLERIIARTRLTC